jgi:hypothetical protein
MVYETLTNGQLISILQQNKYLLVRLYDNELIGINCKVALITARKIKPSLQKHSIVQSYLKCGLSEYLSYKIPIVCNVSN